jgi:hypothetical protein
MIVIKHGLTPYFFQLFPNAIPGDLISLKTTLEKYYLFHPCVAKVSIEARHASIKIDIATLSSKCIPPEKVKSLAYEFAMYAMQGFSTNVGSEYSLAGIPGKTFSGHQYLAWCYVSWALGMPDIKDKLGLPYEIEWEMSSSI